MIVYYLFKVEYRAVKLLHRDYDKQCLEAWQREVETMLEISKVKVRGIVYTYEADDEIKRLFRDRPMVLVMEYCAGGDLRKVSRWISSEGGHI